VQDAGRVQNDRLGILDLPVNPSAEPVKGLLVLGHGEVGLLVAEVVAPGIALCLRTDSGILADVTLDPAERNQGSGGVRT
jgi:hypothetical protein